MSDQDPLVSVSVIFLNEERFIQETIDSVFAQTYTHWELLLVDDGSSDKSTAIAKRYAQEHPDKVRYLEHENHGNRGMSASRNLSMEKAAGKYIAILDADDVWLPTILEDQVEMLETRPEVGMAYGMMHYWHDWTGNPEDKEKNFIPNPPLPYDSVIQPPALITHIIDTLYGVPGSILIRSSILKETGLFEESFSSLYEDQVFRIKICLNYPVYLSSKTWYKYRQHDDSSCFIGKRNGQEEIIREKFLIWTEQYLAEKGFEGSEAWKVLKKHLFPSRHPILYSMIHGIRSMKHKLHLLISRPSSDSESPTNSFPVKDIKNIQGTESQG